MMYHMGIPSHICKTYLTDLRLFTLVMISYLTSKLWKHQQLVKRVQLFSEPTLEVEYLNKSRTDEYGFVIQQPWVHHHYQDMVDELQAMAVEYPSITRLYSIGTSVQGRELYVLEISDKPGVHEPGMQKSGRLLAKIFLPFFVTQLSYSNVS